MTNSHNSLTDNLFALGLRKGDGLFVHASMKAIGSVMGGPGTVIEALFDVVGDTGLIGMPGFSSDATFPDGIVRSSLTESEITKTELSVRGFDPSSTPTYEMGIIAETFRKWPGTKRSSHPVDSICLNGMHAENYIQEHSLAWSTGEQTPLGRLCYRPSTKILLVGVGWNRCTSLHTAETLAKHRRTKTQRFKLGGPEGSWIETQDVANDESRLFPSVGEALEKSGAVTTGKLGDAICKVCDMRSLVIFATEWIDNANRRSGDIH